MAEISSPNPFLHPSPHDLPPNTQALYRGHISRRYAAYDAAHYYAARSLQSGGRGFLARCRVRKMRASRAWDSYGLSALLLIQAVVRGFLVRKAFARRFQEAIRVKIMVPAAGVLQKCWRGKLGKKEAALRRRINAMATEIQVWGGERTRQLLSSTRRSALELSKGRQNTSACVYCSRGNNNTNEDFLTYIRYRVKLICVVSCSSQFPLDLQSLCTPTYA